MKTPFSIILITLALLVGCSDQKKSAVDELKDNVMAVHDEVMPKMGDIMKYKKQLNNRIDELVDDGAEENAEKIAELKKAVDNLDNSHKDMMNWMHQFNSNFDDMVEDEIMKYLNEQMKKIENVANTTNAALKNAEEILSKWI